MRRCHPVPVAILLLALAAAPALAQTNSAGVALRWDTCFGEGGLDNKVFACDTNAGSETLVGTFRLNAAMQQMTGVEIAISLNSASASLPSWWQFNNTGTCRQTSLSLNITGNPAWIQCVDPWTDQALGGLGGYTVGATGVNNAELTAAVAVPSSAPIALDPDVEYFSFNLVISHAKTVGTGACGGCQTPVCLDFQRLTITSSAGNVDLHDGAPWASSKLCVWQSGAFTSYQHPHYDSCGGLGNQCLEGFWDTYGCAVADPTPTRARTWGLIKTLYR